MNREDDQKLWDLLGRAPEVKVSPFFARNVLRQVREQSSWSSQVRFWFNWRRLIPISALAAAVIGTFLLLQTPAPNNQDLANDSDSIADPIAKIDAQDYEVVADLDDLLAADETSLWDDTSSSL